MPNYTHILLKISSDLTILTEFYTSKKKAELEYIRAIEKSTWGGIDIEKVIICTIDRIFEKELLQ